MICEHCGRETPSGGDFCAHCGAHRRSSAPRTRIHSYAPHPGQHVGLPAVFSTLLPHAGRAHAARFHTLLLAGLAAVVALWAAGLVSAAFVVAAFLVPAIYLTSLRRAEIYRAEPLRTIAVAVTAGALAGAALTALVRHAITTTGGVTDRALIVLVVIVPLVQEVLKPVPAFVLRNRSGHADTVDGLTLGIASGLGLAFAEALVTFVPVIRSIGWRVDPGDWLVPLVGASLLVPLMQASCAGLLTATVWRARRGRLGPLDKAAVAIAPAGHVVFAALAQVAADDRVAQVSVLAAQAVTVAFLLVCVRFLLHGALLDEAGAMGVTEVDCSHCHEHVSAAAFCPNCGSAAPTARSRRSPPVSVGG